MEMGMLDVILQWLQYMSTFDVEVEYHAGTQHGTRHTLRTVDREIASASKWSTTWPPRGTCGMMESPITAVTQGYGTPP